MSIQLEKYKNNSDLRKHLELVKFYEDIFKENKLFRAAVIVGSFAKGCPDRVSDIDLIVFVDDGAGLEAFNFIKEKEPFDAIDKFEGNQGSNLFYKKTIFDNFVSAEIYISEKSSPFKLKKPYLGLFDHDNFLKSITARGSAPKHENFPAITSGGKDMSWALLDLLKWSIRENHDLVKLHILKIAEKLKDKT